MYDLKKNIILVGGLTLFSLFLLFYLLVAVSNVSFERDRFSLDIKYGFVDTLIKGAKVRLNSGVEIGHVEDIFERNLQLYVRVLIDKEYEYKIPILESTQFAIFSEGLLGGRYINIIIPDIKIKQKTDYFSEGDLVRGIDPSSIDQIMYSFSQWFNGKNGGQVIAEIMGETQKLLSLLNGIISINKNDIRLLVKNARRSFSSVSHNLDGLLKNLNTLSSDISELSKIHKNDISFLIINLSKITGDLHQLTRRVAHGKGSLGKILQDDEIYYDISNTIKNAKDLLALLKEQPWLLLYKQE